MDTEILGRMELKEILNLMRIYGIRPRKKLSQVFLVNRGVLERIARVARQTLAKISTTALEIGCGPGTLSIFLLREGFEVIAVEIDSRFAPILQRVAIEFPKFNPVIADARMVLQSRNVPLVAVGNLPYHISSELLLAIARSKVRAAVVTLQREVAERIVAKPGTDSFGRLSVIMQLVFEARIAFVIPPKYFRPRPEVASATVVLERVREYDELLRHVEDVTRCLFSYRNKLLSKALRECFPQSYRRIVEGVSICNEMRVRELEPQKFLEIARICVESGEC